MSPEDPTAVLNRLLVIHNRSLPMYLSYAPPYQARNNGAAQEALDNIVADQKEFVDRFGEMVISRGGIVRHGEFPMEFTGYHDLSLNFLIRKMRERQEREITLIEQCVEQLESHPLEQAVAAEALGAAKGHLDTLKELSA